MYEDAHLRSHELWLRNNSDSKKKTLEQSIVQITYQTIWSKHLTVALRVWLPIHLSDISLSLHFLNKKLKLNLITWRIKLPLWMFLIFKHASPPPSYSSLLNPLKTSSSICCSVSDCLSMKSNMASLSSGWFRQNLTWWLAHGPASVSLWNTCVHQWLQ